MRSWKNFFIQRNVWKVLICIGSCLIGIYAYGASFGTPQREFSIVATAEGFYPKKLAFFVGEKIHLFLTTTQHRSCFMFDKQGIFLGMKQGELVESTVYFDNPGVFKFYCPVGKIKGEFVVLPIPRKGIERKVASEPISNKVKVWMPAQDEEDGK